MIKENAPGVAFQLRFFLGPGSRGFDLYFCLGGGEFAHKKLPGGFAQGMVSLGTD